MILLAVDPGPVESGWVVYDAAAHAVLEHGTQQNETLTRTVRMAALDSLMVPKPHLLAVEKVVAYGMAVGQETFDTAHWSGRFVEAWGGRHLLVPRREVKQYLTGSVIGTDASVNAAVRDRFGGSRCKGTKKHPGPLHGFSGDAWAALALALTAAWKEGHQEKVSA